MENPTPCAAAPDERSRPFTGNRDRAPILVHRDHDETPLNSQATFPAGQTFGESLDPHDHGSPPDALDLRRTLQHLPHLDRGKEIHAIGCRHDHRPTRHATGGHDRGLAHETERGTREQRSVMVGLFGKNHLDQPALGTSRHVAHDQPFACATENYLQIYADAFADKLLNK